MAESFKGTPYPILKDAKGYLRASSGMNKLKSDLLVLLLTNPGERVMLPEFGTGLRSLFFEPNDSIARERARELIINAIRTWEPRITLESLEVTSGIDGTRLDSSDDRTQKNNILFIRMTFVDHENIQEIQELKLTVPLQGAS